MKKIEKRIKDVLGRGEKILVSGVPVGYPDIESTRKMVEIYITSGIDIVEFSMPTLNPYIDTAVIADANRKSLELEPDLQQYFDICARVRQDYPEEPFYMMAYADIIQAYGVEPFVEAIQEIEIDAVELPDKEELVPELAIRLDAALSAAGIYRAYFLKHPCNQKYVEEIKDRVHAFVLVQSIADAAGKRPRVAPENRAVIETLRGMNLDAALILGYGINNPDRIREALAVGADGVIVGTAMIERINEGDNQKFSSFIRSLKDATLPG